MKLDSGSVPALLDDYDAAILEMKSALPAEPADWVRAPQGKWSAGQHAEHVAKSSEAFVTGFERGVEQMRNGELGLRPWRPPHQRFVMWLLMREPFPKGGKAAAFSMPGPVTTRETVFRRLEAAAARYRALNASLQPSQRERLWIVNPFRPYGRWHYRFFEALRVDANHVRHHTRLGVQAARGES